MKMKNDLSRSFLSNRTVEQATELYWQRVEDSKYIYDKHQENLFERRCPCCNHNLSSEMDLYLDRWRIVECDRCLTQFVNPCPDSDALSEYYSESRSSVLLQSIYESRKDGDGGRQVLDYRIQMLKSILRTDSRLLEIGTGTGVMLEKITATFSHLNLHLEGLDLDKEAVATAKSKGLAVHESDVQSFEGGKRSFDVVTAFELIEHLAHPAAFLDKCNELLSPDGFLFITTPNGEGLDNVGVPAAVEGRMLAHAMSPPMHLNSFNPKNLYYMLLARGFDIIDLSTPGIYDVEMVTLHDQRFLEYPFTHMKSLSSEDKAFIQDLIVRLGSSGHMAVLARKRSD